MFRTAVTLPLILIFANPVFAQDADKPERWESDISRFEQQISDGTSKPGSVLFLGSSSIRKWDLTKWFPNDQTINHGFGGSEVSDSLYFFDRIVKPLKPSMIVMYAGDNDIAKGKTAEIVRRDFSRFVKKVKDDLGTGTTVAFIAIKPSIKRWNLSKEMAQANQLIATACESDEQLVYIDVWTPMLGQDGLPKPELFAGDNLHLSEAGYELWTGVVRKFLPAVE